MDAPTQDTIGMIPLFLPSGLVLLRLFRLFSARFGVASARARYPVGK